MSLPTGRGKWRVKSWGRARNSIRDEQSTKIGRAKARAIGVGLIDSLLLHDGVNQECCWVHNCRQ